MPAETSRGQNGLRPLKMLLARPSQKLRKLKIALIIVGVLRGSTCRVLTPCTLKVVESAKLQTSCFFAAFTLATLIPTKLARKTPCEETTSLLSNTTAELRSSGSATWWNGKSSLLSV